MAFNIMSMWGIFALILIELRPHFLKEFMIHERFSTKVGSEFDVKLFFSLNGTEEEWTDDYNCLF